MVFVDVDADNTVDAGIDTIVRVQEAFKGNTGLAPATTLPVQFNSQGQANITPTFTLSPYGCTTGDTGSRDVSIGTTGRAGVTESNCP